MVCYVAGMGESDNGRADYCDYIYCNSNLLDKPKNKKVVSASSLPTL